MHGILTLFIMASLGHSATAQENSFFVLGTLHGNMLEHPHYHLREFLRVIDTFKPTVILTESRPDFPGPVEASISGAPEQSLVYAYAAEKIKVKPVDWLNAQNQIDLQRQESQLDAAHKKELDNLWAQFQQAFKKATFLELHGAPTQKLVRTIFAYQEKNGIQADLVRNQQICTNIGKQLSKLKNERILVIFGLAHKYYLEECLEKTGARHLSLGAWYVAENKIDAKLTDSVKKKAVRSLEQAKKLLGERLKSNHYKVDLKNLKFTHGNFDKWIQKTNEI